MKIYVIVCYGMTFEWYDMRFNCYSIRLEWFAMVYVKKDMVELNVTMLKHQSNACKCCKIHMHSFVVLDNRPVEKISLL